MSLDLTQRYPQGLFRAAITPLLRWDTQPAITSDDYIWLDQFSDVQYAHPLNDGRTASLALSMHDPVVASLRPYEQALLLAYVRPGADPAHPERLFWGPCNPVDDYAAGTVTLNGVDPAFRLSHHYLRIGDRALNYIYKQWKGKVPVDDRGILLLVEAGTYGDGVDSFPAVPILGLATKGLMFNVDLGVEVERGQEVWQTIVSMSEAEGGPDFDLKPNHSIAGTRPAGSVTIEGRCYAVMTAYNPPFTPETGTGGTRELQRDLTAVVVFQYGQPADNVTGLTVTPEHASNDVIVVNNAQSYRSRARYNHGIDLTGPLQDWIIVDPDSGADNPEAIEQTAIAHITTYGEPLQVISVELRPDTGQDFFYGDPDAVGLGVYANGDFYVGDLVTVQAVRGQRSIDARYRVTKVELSSDANHQITTKLTLIPTITDTITYELDTQPTSGAWLH